MKRLFSFIVLSLAATFCFAQGGVTNPDFTASEAATVSIRNAYPVGLRKWGMLITVYADPTPTNNKTYYLKYNQASTSKGDNNNWVDASSAFGGIYAGTSPATVGFAGSGVQSGYVLTGKSFSQIVQDAFAPYVNPVFTSFSVSGQATTVEVGTTLSGSKTFTWSITQNSGVVNTIDLFDNTAAATLLAATPNDGSQAQTITTIQLNSSGATQSWKGIGNNSSPSGTFNSSNFVVTARFVEFYGASSSTPTNSAQVRALPNNGFYTTGNTFILNTGTTLTKFDAALPPGASITQVIDLDALNANITSQYVNTSTIGVLDAGSTSRSYTLFEMNVGSPYSSNHRHQITTN